MSKKLAVFAHVIRHRRPEEVAVVEDVGRLNRVEAMKTYIEQTKLLVTLSSAFLVAPAALLALDPAKVRALRPYVCTMAIIETFFIVSVLAGYVVLSTVVGSQDDGTFNVYRGATRFWSFLQFGAYVFGLIGFVKVVIGVTAA
jgi:hypothetical protein